MLHQGSLYPGPEAESFEMGSGVLSLGDPLGDWIPPLDHYGGEAEAWMHSAFPGLPTHPVTCQPALHSVSQLVHAT